MTLDIDCREFRVFGFERGNDQRQILRPKCCVKCERAFLGGRFQNLFCAVWLVVLHEIQIGRHGCACH